MQFKKPILQPNRGPKNIFLPNIFNRYLKVIRIWDFWTHQTVQGWVLIPWLIYNKRAAGYVGLWWSEYPALILVPSVQYHQSPYSSRSRSSQQRPQEHTSTKYFWQISKKVRISHQTPLVLPWLIYRDHRRVKWATDVLERLCRCSIRWFVLTRSFESRIGCRVLLHDADGSGQAAKGPYKTQSMD